MTNLDSQVSAMKMTHLTTSKSSKKKGKPNKQVRKQREINENICSKDVGAFDIDSKVKNGRLALIYK